MVEPRSLSFNSDRWLTDSRVYNLIWLGRWLERAENVARVVNTLARLAIAKGMDMPDFQESLTTAAAARGMAIEHPSMALPMLLKDHQASSISHSIATARSNATHVGTVELIRAINDVLQELNDETNMLDTPLAAQTMTDNVLEALGRVYTVIDDSWFHQEPLSEEEVYRRFVQQ